MRLPFVITILLFQPLLLHPHSDPVFLSGRLPYQFLANNGPANAFGNPAVFPSQNRIAWFAGVTNHYGVSNFNTIATGVSLSSKSALFSLAMAHSPLPENQYSRTKGVLNISLGASDNFAAGISLRGTRIRLPANYGSSWVIGGAAGISTRPGKNIRFDIAAAYMKNPEPESGNRSYHISIIADAYYRFSHNTTMVISTEMISELKPQASALLVVEVFDWIKIMVGAGTGRELFSAGASVTLGNLTPGMVSSFNPAVGRTGSLFIDGKSKKP